MPWVEVFTVFLVSHLAGDFVLQTEWQAVNKQGGLGRNRTARRALLLHIATYALAFVPALAWLATDSIWVAMLAAALVVVPHLIQDDGRLLRRYIESVKHARPDERPGVAVAVDQSFHLVTLLAVALLVGS